MRLRIQSILQEHQIRVEGHETAYALVAFFVEHEDQCFAGCCRLKQTVGAGYEGAPLEVGPAQAYEGPEFDYQRFRAIVERQYRQHVGGYPEAVLYVCNVGQINGHSEEL